MGLPASYPHLDAVEVSRALNARYAIVHVMGDQCGETAQEIIKRKIDDCEKRGAPFTLWAEHSRRAKPEHVRSLCCKGAVYLYLVADLRGGRIRMPGLQTKAKYRPATHYNPGDRQRNEWKPISDLNISDVTDSVRHLDNQNGYALVLREIQLLDRPSFPLPTIRMQEWADVTEAVPVPLKTGMGFHAVCAERKDMSNAPNVWVKERVIIATAAVVEPFAVWLK